MSGIVVSEIIEDRKIRHVEARKAISQLSYDLIEALPDLAFFLDEGGNVLTLNTLAQQTLSRSVIDLEGKNFLSLLDPFFHVQFSNAFQRCLTSGQRYSDEVKLTTSDGVQHDVVLSMAPFRGNHDTVPTVLVIARDITDVKQKDLDLLRFSNVAHLTVNPIEITGPDGNIIYVNPAFEHASGYSKEEIIGKNPNIFGSGKHPKSFWQKMWSTINAGKVWVGEIENKKRNGDPFITQLLISPIIGNEGKIIGYFGVHRDITAQRNLEKQLIHAQKMESIGLLAAGIAHEVGNPLTSISSLVQIIQRTTVDKFTQEKLELIKSQVNRISRIIRDLVDFSRRSSYEVQLSDINKSIREAVDIVRVGKKAKSISFTVELEQGLPSLHLVEDQIEQVFINILINAVDAIHSDREVIPPESPRRERGQVVVRSFRQEDSVVITIRDNGKGISESGLSKIFEPFYTTKRVGEGTGLGLWVSYGIIKSFQGTITVDSTLDEGTIFTIALPIETVTQSNKG